MVRLLRRLCPFRCRSPRTPLIVVAVVAMISIQVLAVLVSGAAARDAAVAEASSALESEVELTIERVERFLDPAERIVEDTVRLLHDDVVRDEAGLERYLLTRLSSVDDVGFAHVGYPDGSAVLVEHDPGLEAAAGDDRYTTTRITRTGPGRASLVSEALDDALRPTGEVTEATSSIDVRSRPWYELALASDGLVWSDPFVFQLSGKPGVTASRAVVVDGEVVAVVGVDIELADFDALMDRIHAQVGHSAYLLGPDGVVASTPDVASPPRVRDGELALPTEPHVGLTLPPANEAGRAERVRTGDVDELVVVRSLTSGPDWRLAVRQDVEQPTGLARAQQASTLKITIGGTALVLAALALLMRLSRPIEALVGEAATDPLTGAANRRGIDAAGAALVAALRDDEHLIVLTLDLDGFKALNDAHGHHVGDDALRIVGRELRRMTRRDDLVGRLGGDEFVVAQRVGDAAQGIEIARRVVERLSSRLGHALPQCPVGVTGGATAGDATRTFGELLRDADAALLRAKAECKGMMRVSDATIGALFDGPATAPDGGDWAPTGTP